MFPQLLNGEKSGSSNCNIEYVVLTVTVTVPEEVHSEALSVVVTE